MVLEGEIPMTYTIDRENNITAHPGTVPASAADLQQFTSLKVLAKLAAEWPISRLVEIWNSFTGVAPFDDLKPVKKFTNRKIAVARIYKAVERLSATTAQPAPDVASVPERSKATPTPRKRRDTSPRSEEGAARCHPCWADLRARVQARNLRPTKRRKGREGRV